MKTPGYVTPHFLFFKSPRLMKQGLHLSLILSLASLHVFAQVEVAFTAHGRRLVS